MIFNMICMKMVMNVADKILAKKAWSRFRAKDSSIGEKAAALAVSGLMKSKTRLGMGFKTKRKKTASKKKLKKKIF